MARSASHGRHVLLDHLVLHVRLELRRRALPRVLSIVLLEHRVKVGHLGRAGRSTVARGWISGGPRQCKVKPTHVMRRLATLCHRC